MTANFFGSPSARFGSLGSFQKSLAALVSIGNEIEVNPPKQGILVCYACFVRDSVHEVINIPVGNYVVPILQIS